MLDNKKKAPVPIVRVLSFYILFLLEDQYRRSFFDHPE
ncbi:hypothetical protein CU029_1899 [Enterococcus faecium]|nr:hypothetical protein [Enterococcus faecium]